MRKKGKKKKREGKTPNKETEQVEAKKEEKPGKIEWDDDRASKTGR